MFSFALLLAIVFGGALYFAPSIVAVLRKKSNVLAIVALNMLLGWSVLGWVISMVWALSNDAPQTIVIHNHSKE